MEKKIILAVSCLILVLSCKKDNSPPPAQSDVNLKSGLLVYLPFDGNIADSSGNGNTTIAVGGAALTNDQQGNPNSAFGGTGNGERIFVKNNGSIKFDDAFTVSVDVMIKNLQNQAFVTMVNDTTGKGVSFGFGMGIPGLYNVEMAVTNSLAGCNDYNTTANTDIDTSQYIMAPGSWYNMVTTFHEGTLQIFVNGKLVSTLTGAGTTVPICSLADVIIGGWWDGDPQSINGTMDEVRLYNRVLNADEITALAKGF